VVNREDPELNVNSEPCIGLTLSKSTMFRPRDVDQEKHKKIYALKSQLQISTTHQHPISKPAGSLHFNDKSKH
jgi:hypothetical protein